jgi:hypothetical protein
MAGNIIAAMPIVQIVVNREIVIGLKVIVPKDIVCIMLSC